MSDQVPVTGERRGYESPRRASAARRTRLRIRAAATDLFLGRGYALTSMRSIAQSAGVAEKTVYLQFESKVALLKEVVETAIVGDDEAVPAAGREWFLDIVAEPDLHRKLEKLVEATSALHERSGPVFAMARGAAGSDPDVAALWAFGKRGHQTDMTLLAQSFEEAGHLPRGVEVEWLTTSLYVLLGLESWHLVRVELELDPAGYRAWLHLALSRTLSGG